MTVSQHVDRVGCARRADRARRDHVPLPRGPPGRAGALRAARRALVALRHRRRRGLRPRGRRSTPPRSRRRSRGARTPARRRRSPASCPSRRTTDEQRALDYMGLDGRHAARRTSRSTASSSARARTAASSDLRAAAEVVRGKRVARQRAARWSCPGSMRGQGRGRGARASIGSSPTRASSGATRAARCASA